MPGTHWGSDFDPDELAKLETRMWKAYYRRQPARLFGLLVMAIREQAHVSWPRALAASVLLTRAAAGFARATGDYERFAPDIVRCYRMLGLPEHVDIDAVARHELRWWVVRREIGLEAGTAAGESITDLYATLYGVPRESVAEAGRLRGIAAEIRDRGATVDPDGPRGAGATYWPEVGRLLRQSYRSLSAALSADDARSSDEAGSATESDRTESRVPVEAGRRGRSSSAVAGTAADEPPAEGEDAGRDDQLGNVPRNERGQPVRDRLVRGQVETGAQPGQPDGVDDERADQHHRERAAEPSIPAELGQPPDERAGEQEADEIAAGRAGGGRRPTLALGEERQADEPEEHVQGDRREPPARAERATDDEDPEGLPGPRHGVARDRQSS